MDPVSLSSTPSMTPRESSEVTCDQDADETKVAAGKKLAEEIMTKLSRLAWKRDASSSMIMDQDEFLSLCPTSQRLEIPARDSHTQLFSLPPGASLHWQVLFLFDLSFSLWRRKMAGGGSVEESLIEPTRHRRNTALDGEWTNDTVDEECHLVACLDNTKSLFRSAHLLFSFTIVPSRKTQQEEPSKRPPPIDTSTFKVLSIQDVDATTSERDIFTRISSPLTPQEDEDDNDDEFFDIAMQTRR